MVTVKRGVITRKIFFKVSLNGILLIATYDKNENFKVSIRVIINLLFKFLLNQGIGMIYIGIFVIRLVIHYRRLSYYHRWDMLFSIFVPRRNRGFKSIVLLLV